MIKLLLVDDEKLICEGLSLLLGNYEDIEVIGTCNNGLEAVRFCRSNKPDVVLMDIRMPKCDGVEGTRLTSFKYKPMVSSVSIFARSSENNWGSSTSSSSSSSEGSSIVSSSMYGMPADIKALKASSSWLTSCSASGK